MLPFLDIPLEHLAIFGDLRQLGPIRRNNNPGDEKWLAVGLALNLLRKSPDRRVLLITPFRNQADLLRKLVQAYLSSYSQVRAGTVHVCQGQEADLVIFDPVDPLHSWLMGRLGKKEIERVLCVAFSRARTHLVVLGKREEIQGSPLLGPLCLNAMEQPVKQHSGNPWL
ncbi:MAG: hypothetical protein HYU64_00075 [Armatimonadetes bacterium]|nr:hypothetical protein [Armatimonadota bacterium]